MNTEETMKPTVILLQAKQHVNELFNCDPFYLKTCLTKPVTFVVKENRPRQNFFWQETLLP